MSAHPKPAPRVEGRRVYRSEYTWQIESLDYQRRFERLIRRAGPLRVVRDLEALRLVRAIVPAIRTRLDLWRATAWRPEKIVMAAGQTRYLSGPLEAWARARA